LKQARPQFDFCCIHHADDTTDTRKLKKHVERDEEDKITSQRKKEATTVNARGCSYLIFLSYKQVGRRGLDEYSLVLGISNNTHSHSMAVNPLRYKKEHVKTLPAFLPAFELGKSLRTAHISYSVALRVLKQIGFPLDCNTYYNIRSRKVSADLDEFAGLIMALEDAGFIFKC
jgi:hypothetical protein